MIVKENSTYVQLGLENSNGLVLFAGEGLQLPTLPAQLLLLRLQLRSCLHSPLRGYQCFLDWLPSFLQLTACVCLVPGMARMRWHTGSDCSTRMPEKASTEHMKCLQSTHRTQIRLFQPFVWVLHSEPCVLSDGATSVAARPPHARWVCAETETMRNPLLLEHSILKLRHQGGIMVYVAYTMYINRAATRYQVTLGPESNAKLIVNKKGPERSELPLAALACATGAFSLEAVLCQVLPHTSPSLHTAHRAKQVHLWSLLALHLPIADLAGVWQKAPLELVGWQALGLLMPGLGRLMHMLTKHLYTILCPGTSRVALALDTTYVSSLSQNPICFSRSHTGSEHRQHLLPFPSLHACWC